jgi:hypothetical protein
LLIADVVELRGFVSSDFVSIAQELWVFGVVIAHGEALSEDLSKEWEGSECRDQCNLERVPEQVSEIRSCVWVHWHS